MSKNTTSYGTKALTILTCTIALLTTGTDELFAGGGAGGGSKSPRIVRIQNSTPSGSVEPLLGLDTVSIDDIGNAPLIPPGGSTVGGVSLPFRMGTFEVTIADYTVFLSAVATRSDGSNSLVVESLYDSRMLSDSNIAGITRTGSGTAISPYAYFAVGDGKKPISYVTWFNAARFSNWMHNGGSATADIETGAYTLNGALSGTIIRNPGALWWIPSHDEWFKAAYYKGGGLNSGYWLFPTQSDALPENNASSGTNQANFKRLGLFSVTQSDVFDVAQNYLTAVGTFVNSPSPYGTFDQGGNVEEWTDTVLSTSFGDSRITRGGAWNSGGLNNDVGTIPTALPTDRSSKVGFRLARASIPAGAPVAPSGVISVRIAGDSGRSATIGRGEVTQFSIRAGSFTIEAHDVQNETIGTSRTFTSQIRTSFVTVALRNGQIVLEEAPAGSDF